MTNIDTILGSEGVLTLVHIPKTGGSTLFYLMSRQFRPYQVLTEITDEVLERRGRQNPAQPFDLWGKRVMRVHYDTNVQRLFVQPLTYVTMLRDPVDRVISLYRFIMRSKDHGWHDQVAEMSFMEFLDCPMANYQCHNHMARYLAGNLYGYPYLCELGRKTIGEAIEVQGEHTWIVDKALTALRDMVWFGIMEQYERSIVLMNRTFGWSIVIDGTVNVAPDRTQFMPPDSVRPEIERRNQLDRELYRRAVTLFEERVHENAARDHSS